MLVESMTKKLQALENNKTWIIIDLPKGKRSYGKQMGLQG